MTVRGPGWTGDAILTLDASVDGPVHPPFSTDAAVELAVDPGPPSRALCSLLAVVGATGTADVVRVVDWATRYDVDVMVLGTGGTRRPSGGRPVVAVSLSRADRVVPDPAAGTVRAGVGAAWAAVHRAAADADPWPSAAFSRPGTVASMVGRITLRGATVVTGDGVVHDLPGPGRAAELWWAHRTRPGAVGVVTAIVLDARDTTVVTPRMRTTPEDARRLAVLAHRHDPAGLLGVPR